MSSKENSDVPKIMLKIEVERADRGILKFEIEAPLFERILEIEGDLYELNDAHGGRGFMVDGKTLYFSPVKIRKVKLDDALYA